MDQQLPEEVLAQLIRSNNFEGIKKLFEEFGDLDPNFSIPGRKKEDDEDPEKQVSISYFFLKILKIIANNH